jgi:hypothetical protein
MVVCRRDMGRGRFSCAGDVNEGNGEWQRWSYGCRVVGHQRGWCSWKLPAIQKEEDGVGGYLEVARERERWVGDVGKMVTVCGGC